jgi:arabinose-5-phosphate isomerase
VPILREFGSPLIGIIGNMTSTLARQCDVVLDATVNCEADPNNLAPTSSTTLAMALGDALAIALMQAKRFTAEDFAKYHPGGQLGRNMRLRVADVMHGGNKVAWVSPETSLRQVVIEMTQHSLGAALVIDSSHKLLGLITDGDLRRTLIAHDDIRQLRAADFMTANPLTVSTETLLKDALRVMEDRPSQISVLPVVEERNQLCSGLIRIHDIYLPTLG